MDPDFTVWMVVSGRSVAMTIVETSKRKIAGPNSVVKQNGTVRRFPHARAGMPADGPRQSMRETGELTRALVHRSFFVFTTVLLQGL